MNFTGTYLRILTPRTTNGVIPLTVNGEVQYKEAFAPFGAKRQFEKKALRLTKNGFKHLAPIIEVVGEEVKKPTPRPMKSIEPTESVADPVSIEEAPPAKAPKKNPKPKKVAE